jgi:hypothetical protein
VTTLKEVEHLLLGTAHAASIFQKLTIRERALLVRVTRDLMVQHAAEEVEKEHNMHVYGAQTPCIAGYEPPYGKNN